MSRRVGEAEQDLRPFSRDASGKLRYLDQPLPDGPWHAEPDRAELEEGGLPCLLLRGPMGDWCGYVGLPHDHPWNDIDLISSPPSTGSAFCVTYQRAKPPTQTVPDRAQDFHHWIGFSCAEVGGLSLAISAMTGRWPPRESYRDLAHAEQEVRLLARAALADLPS